MARMMKTAVVRAFGEPLTIEMAPLRRRHDLQGHQRDGNEAGTVARDLGARRARASGRAVCQGDGLHVAALDVTDEKLALARSLGADATVDAKVTRRASTRSIGCCPS